MAKKIIASIMAIVMIVVAINYSPVQTDASQSDVESYNWSEKEYTGSAVLEYVNQYKTAVASGDANVVNIQEPAFTSEAGIYISFGNASFGDITINGTKTTGYAIQGAGICFNLSLFTEMYSELVVNDSSGNVKSVIYVYNEKAESSGTVEPSEPSESPSSIAAPDSVEVYNFYAQEKGYEVNFTAPAVEETSEITPVSYNVYVDSSQVITSVSASGEYINAQLFSDYADNKVHNIYLTTVDNQGNESAKSTAAKVRITTLTNSTADPADISRIYVVTNSESEIVKATKTQASITIISGDSSIKTVSQAGTIKLRGNSTSLADKKAYNIAFNSKQTVFKNAAKGKKWCLLANAYEKAMLRNKLAMDFGSKLGSIAAPEEHYADLYIDGVLKGTYVISEPAENGRAGVEYDDTKDAKGGTDILFELEKDRTEDECLYYTTSTLGVRFVTEETLDTTSERYTKWVDTLTKFEKALSDTSSDDYLQYIDVDTFVDMYIVNELFQTVDFGYSSVKFYITYDESGAPTIHAGPLWDFDLSSGNSSFADVRTYNTMRCQNVNTWFGYLMKNTTFKNKVIEKFKRYQPVIQNIYKSNQLGDSQINKNVALMQQSRIRNYSSASEGGAGWSETVADSAEYSVYPYSYSTVSPYSSYTYDQHVEYLETWLENRNKYLCEAWNIDYDDAGSKAMEYISDDLAITGYQISTSYEGTDGSMGFRTVYQTEPKVEGQTPTEVGIVYGLVYGDNPITKSDVLYGSDNEYVASYSATENGIINEVMGDSKTANYYARTMEVSDQLSTDSLTVQYYIRAYAILPDGTVEYSNVKSYTVFKVADYVYQNNLVSRESSFNYIYSKILARVDSGYVQKDFDWGNTIVK